MTVAVSPLACTVRGCYAPLERRDRSFVCPSGHAYDIARSGYVNLLQPQDRRSRAAGDQEGAVAARARLLAAGIGAAIVGEASRRAAGLNLGAAPVVADLGCGSGDLLGTLAELRPIAGVGIDLATAAAERAARRFPRLTWVVANADRRLPFADASVSLVLSFHGRRNPPETSRVLAPGGYLLAAVPAAEDLTELRAAVSGSADARPRTEALVAEHQPGCTLLERTTVRERHHLERDALLDLLLGTYRGERRSAADRLAALDALEVTLSTELLLFARGE